MESEYESIEIGDGVIESYGGGTPRRKTPEFWNGDIAWTRSSHIHNNGSVSVADWITEDGLKASSTNLVPAGALLVGTRVGVGKVAVIERPMAISQDLTGLVVDDSRVDPEFMMYAMKSRSVQAQFEAATRGSTIKGVPRTDLLSFRIPLPPLPEQRAIARVLRTVQQAREATEQVIDAARELKRSVMQRLFSGDFDEATVESVADVLVSTAGVEQIQSKVTGSGGQKVLYLKVSDLAASIDGRWVDRSALEFDEIDVSELRLAPPQATLFPKRGAAISTNRKRQNKSVAALDPNLIAVVAESVRSDYLFRWFEYFDLRTLVPPDVIPQINKKDIAPLAMAVPDHQQQEVIARTMDVVDSKILSEEQRLQALDQVFSSLLSDVMSGQLRVPESMSESAA